MRLIGLDVGEARIGVAISDEEGIIASPHAVLRGDRGRASAIEQIGDLCSALDIKKIVVGLPLSLSGGGKGKSAARARAFGEQLGRVLKVEIVYWDERFSTVQAKRVLDAAGVRSNRQRKAIDKIAACLILQGYLDAPKDHG